MMGPGDLSRRNSLYACRGKAAYINPFRHPAMVGASCTGFALCPLCNCIYTGDLSVSL